MLDCDEKTVLGSRGAVVATAIVLVLVLGLVLGLSFFRVRQRLMFVRGMGLGR